MATFQIRERITDILVSQYESETKKNLGGLWSDTSRFVHVEIPSVIDPDCVKIVNDLPVEDATKLAAKIAKIKNIALLKVRKECNDALNLAISRYPEREILGFGIKRDLAYKWTALSSDDKTASMSNPMYGMLIYESSASPTVTTVNTLVALIITKAQMFEAYYGACIRIKNTAEAEVNAFTGTLQQVKNACGSFTITWPSLS